MYLFCYIMICMMVGRLYMIILPWKVRGSAIIWHSQGTNIHPESLVKRKIIINYLINDKYYYLSLKTTFQVQHFPLKKLSFPGVYINPCLPYDFGVLCRRFTIEPAADSFQPPDNTLPLPLCDLVKGRDINKCSDRSMGSETWKYDRWTWGRIG